MSTERAARIMDQQQISCATISTHGSWLVPQHTDVPLQATHQSLSGYQQAQPEHHNAGTVAGATCSDSRLDIDGDAAYRVVTGDLVNV